MSQTNILLESGTNELEIVEFFIDHPDGYRAHYGVNVAKVVEIIRRQPITSMPEMRHSAICGAFHHRNDRVVPLIDLGKFLEIGPIESPDAKTIVTEFNNLFSAFLVSGVDRIHRLSWTEVEAPGNFLQNASKSSVVGVVRLENRVVFLLDLEAIVAELEPSMAIRFEGSISNATEGRIYNILHADDSHSIRQLVLDLFKKEGRFQVRQVENGQKAWDFLCSLRTKCEEEGKDITEYLQGVISDIEMPFMDGLNLCRRIKEDPVLKKLPVAIFSSMINEPLAKKCESVGADAQFAKPDLRILSDRMLQLILGDAGDAGRTGGGGSEQAA
ncbi:MAG: chemotaxis protein CheV [Desulfovibrio sp.]|nr:chemotaxis protein CheV [Desulfovibrio sp.]